MSCCDVNVISNYVWQVRDKLISLGTKRGDMVERWESRWEHLQLSEISIVFTATLLNV